jgi:hypothetical protein
MPRALPRACCVLARRCSLYGVAHFDAAARRDDKSILLALRVQRNEVCLHICGLHICSCLCASSPSCFLHLPSSAPAYDQCKKSLATLENKTTKSLECPNLVKYRRRLASIQDESLVFVGSESEAGICGNMCKIRISARACAHTTHEQKSWKSPGYLRKQSNQATKSLESTNPFKIEEDLLEFESHEGLRRNICKMSARARTHVSAYLGTYDTQDIRHT